MAAVLLLMSPSMADTDAAGSFSSYDELAKAVRQWSDPATTDSARSSYGDISAWDT